MKIDVRHLAQLAAVIEAGSVTAGAALLGISQPGVSRTLSMLEKRLGEPLFVPGRRPLEPTPICRQLGLQGKAVLAASRKAADAVRGHRLGTLGRVRLGGVPFFMDAVISAMIASFQARQPDILVEQSYGHMPDLLAMLDSNQIELAITPIGTPDLGPDYVFEPLLPGRNVIACAVGHPLMRKRPLTARDLSNYPWVAPLPGSPLMLDLHAILMTLSLSELSIRYSGGSLMSVVNYVSLTDALAILPHSVVFSLRKENRVSILPLGIPQPERTLGIIRRPKAPLNGASIRLIDHIVSEFQDMKRMIERHERSIVWGRGPFLPRADASAADEH